VKAANVVVLLVDSNVPVPSQLMSMVTERVVTPDSGSSSCPPS
jgi:hypothetical protein